MNINANNKKTKEIIKAADQVAKLHSTHLSKVNRESNKKKVVNIAKRFKGQMGIWWTLVPKTG